MDGSLKNGEWCGKRGVIVVGASGAGKSTLLKHLREELGDVPSIQFPVRHLTRRPRADDDPAENAYVSMERLAEHRRRNEVLLQWTKPISDGTQIVYAFKAGTDGILVLGGNEALFDNRETIHPSPSLLDDFLVVGVWCEESTRISRLMARNPDLSDQQAELRTRAKPASRHALNHAHLVVDNSGELDTPETRQLVDGLRRMARDR